MASNRNPGVSTLGAFLTFKKCKMENQGRSPRQQSNNEAIAFVAVLCMLLFLALVLLNSMLTV